MDDAVKEFWNARDARDFDARARESGRMKAINRVAVIAKPYLSEAGAISIDLGCGTGLFAKAVGIRNIVGIDFSFSLLTSARRRMDKVWQKNIFELQISNNAVHNIISLFVMDDYPSEKKLTFFGQVFSFLKPGGLFFFAAYSPNDERMGKLREVVNAKVGLNFEVYLEDASFYEDSLKECGFILERTEIIKTDGVYETDSQVIRLKREFIVMIASKPYYMI